MRNEERKKERKSKQELHTLISPLVFQPASSPVLYGRENRRAKGEGKRIGGSENGNVCERERFLSPLSSLSPIATAA